MIWPRSDAGAAALPVALTLRFCPSWVNRTTSVQIALRLPEPDVTKARELATRKGIGYQTLLKMLVHEGLRREARKP